MRSLERRINRLERGSHSGADIDRARAIFHAYNLVRDHPEQATEAERALAAETSHEDWQRAFLILVEAAGGLEAVVRESMNL